MFKTVLWDRHHATQIYWQFPRQPDPHTISRVFRMAQHSIMLKIMPKICAHGEHISSVTCQSHTYTCMWQFMFPKKHYNQGTKRNIIFPFKSAVCISAPLAESIIWKFRVGKLFCIFERMLTKAVFIWCNKNSNILKYYYHLKELFSIWMHFKMQFIPVMQIWIFSIITPVLKG